MDWRMPDIPVKYRKLYEQGRAGKAKAAIRCHCLLCVGWEEAEVERCTTTGCPLYTPRKSARSLPISPDQPPHGINRRPLPLLMQDKSRWARIGARGRTVVL
jgi:hypothetical protein